MLIRVVILAAGKGKRMGADVPKPLVSVAGKPMIRHLFERVIQAGIDSRPVLVVSPEGEKAFRAELGGTVQYMVQREPKGTGHAIRTVVEMLSNYPSHLLVLYGDHPFLPSETLRNLSKLSENNPDAFVMLSARVPSYDASHSIFFSWGRIIRDEKGNVSAIREVKDASEEERKILEINPGLFVFPFPWLKKAIYLLTENDISGEYYLTDLVSLALRDGIFVRTENVPVWDVAGINTPEDLEHLGRHLFHDVS